MKTLSIVVPSYNMEKYIGRCLDSFISEKIMDRIEVLVINDGSKDSTLQIAKGYEEKYPGTFIAVDKINGGHGSTINKGIELATGKYFKVVDADDWVDTDALIKLVDFLDACDSDLVATHFATVNLVDDKKEEIRFNDVEFERNYSWPEIVAKKMVIPMHSITYKTSVLKDNGIRLQEKTFYVDIEYNLLPVPYVYSIIFFDIVLYQYFLGRPDQSVARNSLLKNYDHTVRVDRRIFKYYSEVEMKEQNREYLRFFLVSFIRDHYYSLANLPDKPANNYKRCVEYDAMLKELSPELYGLTGNWYINLIRKTGGRIVKVLSVIQPLWSFKVKPALGLLKPVRIKQA
ncbi:MAG TPA: glycosyltransferase family 2 protein [Acetivibrio sp.]|nr:glycosyltransferase family 2 protein [Acetivibrio sp.]